MNELLNAENLVELHKQLDDFARYHHKRGGKEAHRILKDMWNKDRLGVRDGEKSAILRDEGYDKAMQKVLDVLYAHYIA